jgi:hypothetical protein
VNRYPSGSSRARLLAVLASLGLDYDVYDQFGGYYGGIGRREDRQNQAPRPPQNGATRLQLEPYDCIWYSTRTLSRQTMSDRTTLLFLGGHPSQDQQALENWLAGCSDPVNRLLIVEGSRWAPTLTPTPARTGLPHLSRVDVLASDYAHELAANDSGARITGAAPALWFDGEARLGCLENPPLSPYYYGVNVSSHRWGEAVARFVESPRTATTP